MLAQYYFNVGPSSSRWDNIETILGQRLLFAGRWNTIPKLFNYFEISECFVTYDVPHH